MSRSKAQTSLLTATLFTSVVIVGITTIVTIGEPTFQQIADAKAVDEANNILSSLNEQIEQVAAAGEGSQLEVGIRFSRGEFIFDAGDDQITYKISTAAEIISPHSSRGIGNLRLSALAGTSVEKDVVDGEDCWRIENEHISVCIRAIPRHQEDAVTAETAGFYRFNQDGQTIYDNSSAENHGIQGISQFADDEDPSRVTGVAVTGLRFDGVDDHVTVPDHPGLNAEPVTAAAWVRNEAGPGKRIILHNGGPDAGVFQYSLRMDADGAVSWNVNLSGAGTVSARGGNLSQRQDEWVHIVGMADGDAARLYVDGDVVDEAGYSNSIAATTHDVWIGDSGDNNATWSGVIDEVRVWNTSLNDEQIAWLHASRGLLNYIDTRDLVLQYRNKDENKNLSADFAVSVDSPLKNAFSRNGTGYTQPDIEGDGLGRGTVTARVRSFFGVDYQIQFTVISESDFLKMDVIRN